MSASTAADDVRDYPRTAADRRRVEPAPRRVRGYLNGRQVFDTTAAHYFWELAYYPQYYVPLADVDHDLLVDEDHGRDTVAGPARMFGLRAGDVTKPGAVRVYGADASAGVADTARFQWDALDAWFEEDEEVFVHPRSPYVRVDALRSARHVRVELDGVVLAETTAPVLVFETGLPTRYYVPRLDVAWQHLVPTDTRTSCPYKGNTTGYWSVSPDGGEVREGNRDLAWSYDFPTRQLLPVTGMVAFLNERVDVIIDGRPIPRPTTHMT